MIKYSIVMTVFNRYPLLIKTLESFVLNGYGEDTEVIIVDDASETPVEINPNDYKFHLKIIRVEKYQKNYTNPCIPYNLGFKYASGDFIIIQNSECYHLDSIVDFLKTNDKFPEKNYYSFACYSLSKDETDTKELNNFVDFLNSPVLNDGSSGWYNHSKFRPVGYHFCCAIRKVFLDKLGGFNPNFGKGSCFDDDEFLFRVKKYLNIIFVDDFRVLHQWHYTSGIKTRNIYNDNLFLRNKLLYIFGTRLGLNDRLVLSIFYPLSRIAIYMLLSLKYKNLNK